MMAQLTYARAAGRSIAGRCNALRCTRLGQRPLTARELIRVCNGCATWQTGDDLERVLYLRRRAAAKRLVDEGLDWRQDMYFCSASTRTVVYKGMTNASALGGFYQDLRDEQYRSNFCVYHRRFSTNTMPRWPLAQV
jgi:glutamate synthase domain-containing protein 1